MARIALCRRGGASAAVITLDGVDTKKLSYDQLKEMGTPCSCRWLFDHKHQDRQVIFCRYHEAMEDRIERLKRRVKKLANRR